MKNTKYGSESQSDVTTDYQSVSLSWCLCYDRLSVRQSGLVSGTHLGPMTSLLLLSDSCVFVEVGHPL
jgi:hypothetical protein